MSKTYQDLILAVHKALNGDWDGSHKIVQDMVLDLARWTHAVLHKIEGDEPNSRYWYSRSRLCEYEDYENTKDELSRITKHINDLSLPK